MNINERISFSETHPSPDRSWKEKILHRLVGYIPPPPKENYIELVPLHCYEFDRNLASWQTDESSVKLISSVDKKKLAKRAAEAIREANAQNDIYLDLKRSYLLTLPDAIGNLVCLQTLNLRNNVFRSFPTVLCSLWRLQWLDLSCNYLTTIPEAIGELTQLKFLSFSNNQLKNIPDSIGNLTELEVLDFFFNNLESLPKAIVHLKKLKKINIGFNKIPIQALVIAPLSEIPIYLVIEGGIFKQKKLNN